MTHFIVRWRLSAELDGDGARSASVARHLEGCAACRAHAARLYAMHDRLSLGAAHAPRSVRAASSMLWPALAAGAMATALIAVLASMPASSQSRSTLAPHVATETPGAVAPTTAVAVSPTRRIASSLSSIAFIADADPLRTELAALKVDARHGAKIAARIAGIKLD